MVGEVVMEFSGETFGGGPSKPTIDYVGICIEFISGTYSMH